MDIGSIFPLKTINIESNPKQLNTGNLYNLSLCREAFVLIARRYDNLRKKVLLPAFTCSTVVKPFKDEGWDCSYYSITESLRIDANSFSQRLSFDQPSVVVVHPFFGAKLNEEEVRMLKLAKKKGCILIVDNTQCIFDDERLRFIDYYVGSFRKWLNCPDGGFLEVFNGEKFPTSDELTENSLFARQMAQAMYLRELYFSTGDENLKTISIELNKQAIRNIPNPYEPHKISPLSQSIWQECDKNFNINARVRNYGFLHNALNNSKRCTLPREHIEEINTAPLYFPILTKNRAEVQRKLALNHIYAPILWSVYNEELLVSQNVINLYDGLLAIPCDQRYSIEDMNKIAETLI